MNTKQLLLPILLSLVLSACSPDFGAPYQEVTTDEGFSFNLPGQLSRTHELHDFAGVQYANEQQGVYLLGISERKKTLRNLHLFYTLEDYAHAINKKVGMGMDTFQVSVVQPMNLDSLPCISSDIFGEVYGGEKPLKVYYNVSVFESPDYFYQLISWTDRGSMEGFKSELEQIVCSFQALPPHEPILASEKSPGESGESIE